MFGFKEAMLNPLLREWLTRLAYHKLKEITNSFEKMKLMFDRASQTGRAASPDWERATHLYKRACDEHGRAIRRTLSTDASDPRKIYNRYHRLRRMIAEAARALRPFQP